MTSQIPHFPPEIEALPDFDGPFDAHRLGADGCEVLFATYPAGTTIAPHTHSTDNVGVITKGQLDLTVASPGGTRSPRTVRATGTTCPPRQNTRPGSTPTAPDRVLVQPMNRRPAYLRPDVTT